MKQSLDKLNELAEQVAESNGLRIYDLELVGSGRAQILRVYIDHADRSGISLEDCTKFSRAFGDVLDAEDPLAEPYNLEVSSPGVERDLSKKWHFSESVGETIALTLNQPLGKFHQELDEKAGARKKMTGLLKAMSGDQLDLDFEGKVFAIPMQYVSKAYVVFDFSKKIEKGKES